eukprot:5257782-Prymnesium_polylepis.1
MQDPTAYPHAARAPSNTLSALAPTSRSVRHAVGVTCHDRCRCCRCCAEGSDGRTLPIRSR